MAIIRQSANGTQYQNVFCKRKQKTIRRGSRAGEVVDNFEGYATIGNKVVKISVSPRPATNNRGEDGYYVTVVATTFQPRNTGTVGSNRGAKF